MLNFQVLDMTCGHCVRSITAAVRGVDAAAVLEVDLPAHLVRIDSAIASAESLLQVIEAAGYTPVLVGTTPVAGAESLSSPARKCCCG
jgi:copper chaperone